MTRFFLYAARSGFSLLSAGDAPKTEINVYLMLTAVFGVLAAAMLITSVVLFVRLRVPQLLRESRGSLQRGRGKDSRREKDAIVSRKSSNVFEDLEKKAQPSMTQDRTNPNPGRFAPAKTGSPVQTAVPPSQQTRVEDPAFKPGAAPAPGAGWEGSAPHQPSAEDAGTSVLSKTTATGFTFEKNVIIAASNEVL
ncbi:MAG: hypothetical protein K6C36_06635 [Clostridia bacterium]|nr:hypothetical protein [Clostridia bacterium]